MMCVVGSSMFNLEPLFLAAAAKKFLLDDNQIGWLAGIEIAGIAFASLLAPRWIPSTGYKNTAFLGLIIIIIGNSLSLFVDNYSTLLIIRFITGFGGYGIVYICGIMLLGSLKSPTRAFGLLVFINMLITATTMKLLPLLMDKNPWESIVFYLIGLSIIGLLISRTLPQRKKKELESHSNKKQISFNWHPSIILMLFAILFFSINLGAIWSFTERIGNATGLNLEDIGSYLSTSLPFQALGAMLAVGIGTRYGRIAPLVLVLFGQILGLYFIYIASPGMEWAFFAGISLWGFSWNLGIAFQLGLMSDLPDGQRILGYVPGVEAVGASLGAFIPAFFILQTDYSSVVITASIAVIISSLIFFRVLIRLKPLKIMNNQFLNIMQK